MRIFVCEELINNLKTNIDKIRQLQEKIDSENYEAYLIYSFALFESAICEAVRHILSSFPEKLSNQKQLSISAETIYNNIFSSKNILDSLISEEIKQIGKGSAQILMAKAKSICSIEVLYEPRRLEEISYYRNVLTHENTPSKQEYLVGHSYSEKRKYNIVQAKEDIAYLLCVLQAFSAAIVKKYAKYTRYYLLKSLWNELFDTPLLLFEDCVCIRDSSFGSSSKKVVGFKVDHLKKVSKSISSSEKFFLAILLHQYNDSINAELFSCRDIPMLVSISAKEKIYLFLHIMSVYPHLFNGMLIDTDMVKNNIIT